jgi:hypothetical protein
MGSGGYRDNQRASNGRRTKGSVAKPQGLVQSGHQSCPQSKQDSLAAQTAERIALYGRMASKGDPILIHVNKADIPDNIPSDAKLQDCMRALQN